MEVRVQQSVTLVLTEEEVRALYDVSFYYVSIPDLIRSSKADSKTTPAEAREFLLNLRRALPKPDIR